MQVAFRWSSFHCPLGKPSIVTKISEDNEIVPFHLEPASLHKGESNVTTSHVMHHHQSILEKPPLLNWTNLLNTMQSFSKICFQSLFLKESELPRIIFSMPGLCIYHYLIVNKRLLTIIIIIMLDIHINLSLS